MRRLRSGRLWWLVVGVVLCGSLPQEGVAQNAANGRAHQAPAASNSSAPDAYFGVTLTPEQRVRLTAIRDSFSVQLRTAITNAKKTPKDPAHKRQIDALQRNRMGALMAVLTPEQRVVAQRTLAARQRQASASAGSSSGSSSSARVR